MSVLTDRERELLWSLRDTLWNAEEGKQDNWRLYVTWLRYVARHCNELADRIRSRHEIPTNTEE